MNEFQNIDIKENYRFVNMYGEHFKVTTNINYVKKVVTTIIENEDIKVINQAICHKDDRFDIEFGSKLSYLRAKKELGGYFKSFYHEIIKNSEAIIKVYNNNIRNIDKKQKEIKNKIDKMI